MHSYACTRSRPRLTGSKSVGILSAQIRQSVKLMWHLVLHLPQRQAGTWFVAAALAPSNCSRQAAIVCKHASVPRAGHVIGGPSLTTEQQQRNHTATLCPPSPEMLPPRCCPRTCLLLHNLLDLCISPGAHHPIVLINLGAALIFLQL